MLHDLVGYVEIDGNKIGFAHQDVVGKGLAASGEYKLVCVGHSHEFTQKEVDRTIFLNPGEIMGKDGFPGFSLINTDTWHIKRIELT